MTPIVPLVGGDDLDVTAAPHVIVRCGQDPDVRIRIYDCQFLDEHSTAFAIDVHADGLDAHYGDVIVAVWDHESLSEFVDGLAADFRGWDGSRSWSTNHLRLTAVFHSLGHVEMRWTLRPWVSRPGSWEASVTTWLEAGQQMADLAADIRAFLSRPQPVS